MTAFSLRKTPLEPDIKVEGPLQFYRRSNGDRRLWLSCASACVLEQRVQQDLWLSRDMRHRWTAGDGLVDKIIGNDIRSRILTDIQISLGNRELPREPRRAAKMSFGMSAPKRALVVEARARKATVGRWAEIVTRDQLGK